LYVVCRKKAWRDGLLSGAILEEISTKLGTHREVVVGSVAAMEIQVRHIQFLLVAEL
jgi:hypothetical protein